MGIDVGEVNIGGIVALVLFYMLILGIGLFAAWRRKQKAEIAKTVTEETNEIILAGRSIGGIIGCFTMTATWVGGGYINGTAEVVYNSGLAWAQAPWGYALSLAAGGIFFAKKMREAEYVTMLDPLQKKYGEIMGALLYIPALLGEAFWSASILAALGATLAVILGINMTLATIISALIAVTYTLFGGLYSVAYTDIVQLICIGVGLFLTLPFALKHKHVSSITENDHKWLGEVKGEAWGPWLDYAALLICGGIPWQVYFQRVLSSKSPQRAQILSFVGSFGCFVAAVPAVLLGATAATADWNAIIPNSSFINVNGTITDSRLTLPLVLQYLTPMGIAWVGLGAISAAVMSSADSSVLSASSMFAHNIYKVIFRPKASANEIIWVIRISIFFVGAIACLVGLTIKSIYKLFSLCSDLVFVILFPQLVGAVYIPWVNTYGSACGFILGFFFRIASGEPFIGLPAIIEYPMFKDGKQGFPFRILCMSISAVTLLSVSALTHWLFFTGKLDRKYDIFKVMDRQEDVKIKAVVESSQEKDGSVALKSDVDHPPPYGEESYATTFA